jgi:DNA-binding transcriptional MerR regulator
MRIGQLAQLTGADIQTIRFYERQGLLASPNRQANGYRAYEADHVEKLQNSTIDWVDSILESGFQIDNPQAKRPCGCGQSVDF